tara:strand:+ start:1093 stop:1575 length:483 start_codon:yes stop_codon:yes gene_type:complete
MVVTISGSTGITMPNEGLATSALGNGGIIKCTPSTQDLVQNTTSTSYVDITNSSISVTPTTNTNKILLIWNCDMSNTLVSQANVQAWFNIMRDSTEIFDSFTSCETGAGGEQIKATPTMILVDSPATTSTITYKSQFKTNNASSTVYFWHGSLTALEIVA